MRRWRGRWRGNSAASRSGLEQAGAHIATDRIGFARYLKLWSESRDKALAWTDATVTGSDRTLATTWATSVARLSPESRRLLDRLAFLAPDPVPDSLLDVAVPGEASDADAYEARAGLYAYSLIAGVTAEDGGAPGFVVHRLVQDFARRAMSEERRAQALREALEWVNAAFVGDPTTCGPGRSSIRSRRTRSRSRATRTQAEIAEPTARLFNQLGVLFEAKADYAEAEPLYAPRARDRRKELRPQSSRWSRSASAISRSCFRTQTASPRPSR